MEPQKNESLEILRPCPNSTFRVLEVKGGLLAILDLICPHSVLNSQQQINFHMKLNYPKVKLEPAENKNPLLTASRILAT